MPAVESRDQIVKTYHGVAVEDKENESRKLLVYSEELLPTYEGEIKLVEQDNAIMYEWFSDHITTCNYIECTYNDDTANRPMPPDVRKGEQVCIYNQADTNTWFWKSEGRNDAMRRTEIMRTDISGVDKIEDKTDDNTYFMEMDTREKKRIRMSTSNTNGEKARYLMEVNGAAGTIFLGDDKENSIYLNTERTFIGMCNKNKAQIQLDGDNIILAAPGDIRLLCYGCCTIESKLDMLIHSNKNLKIVAVEKLFIGSGAKMTLCTADNLEEYISGNFARAIGGTTLSASESFTKMLPVYSILRGG